MKNCLFFLAVFVFSLLNAQELEIEWQRCYGGSKFEIGGYMCPTPDGGYILIGQTTSNDYDVTGNDDFKYDGWVVKLRANGEILWQKTLFSPDTHLGVNLHDVKPTSDGGYIIVGVIEPFGGGLDYMALIVKMDNMGNIQWQRVLGDSNSLDSANGVIQTEDGGYMVLINTASVLGTAPFYDFWLVKLSPIGDVQWDKIFGGEGFDIPGKIYKAPNGGYLLTGTSSSDEGEFAENRGGADFLIIKVDEYGEKQWMKLLGGSEDESLRLYTTSDGGFMGAGYSESNNGDVTSEEGTAWLVKLTENCEIQWQRKYNENGFNSFLQTLGGNYILTGEINHNGNSDVFVKQVDGDGELISYTEIIGSQHDYVRSLLPTADNKFMISGYTYSHDGDFSNNYGGTDLWLIKFDSSLSVQEINQTSVYFYPNPTRETLHFTEQLQNIQVYAIDGKKVLQTTAKTSINISQLAQGTYILNAETVNGKKVNVKFVKN